MTEVKENVTKLMGLIHEACPTNPILMVHSNTFVHIWQYSTYIFQS